MFCHLSRSTGLLSKVDLLFIGEVVCLQSAGSPGTVHLPEESFVVDGGSVQRMWKKHSWGSSYVSGVTCFPILAYLAMCTWVFGGLHVSICWVVGGNGGWKSLSLLSDFIKKQIGCGVQDHKLRFSRDTQLSQPRHTILNKKHVRCVITTVQGFFYDLPV